MEHHNEPRAGRSAATRVKLILAAEALFAEHGVDGVPLRAIGEAAGQRNNTSIQYHFGDRMELLQAILEYRSAKLEPPRRKLLEQAERQGRLDDVKTLLRILCGPDIDTYRLEGSLNFLKLTAHYMIHLRPRGVPHPFDRNTPSTASLRQANSLLYRRLSFLSRERFITRLETVTTMMISAYIGRELRGPERGEPLDVLLEDTLEMMTAAMCAPPWPVAS